MLKIMIVEDDLDLLHGLRFLLQAYHCRICPLTDADEILKTVGLLQPDLILLDIKAGSRGWFGRLQRNQEQLFKRCTGLYHVGASGC